MIPKLMITTNKSLDEEVLRELCEDDTDLHESVELQYKEFDKTIKNSITFLENNRERIIRLLPVISEIMEIEWTGIDEIRAYIGLNTINPRFISDSSFILYYKLPEKVLLHFAVHEIVHFLYFKKWAEVFPNDGAETFEFPHSNWILSEILAPVIMRDSRIYKVIISKANLYDDWQKVDRTIGFLEQFEELYNCRTSFADFLKESKALLNKLNNKDELTKSLLDKM